MLFLVAAALWIVVAALYGAEVFLNRAMEVLLGMFGPAAFGVALVGLLGLYPKLADWRPPVARGGAVFIVLGVVGATILAVANLGQLTGMLADQPAWVTAFNFPLLAGVVLGFGTFGIASLWSGTRPRILGLLLLWPAVAFGAIIFGNIILGQSYSHWIHVGHSSTEALAMLALGYVLRTGETPTDHAEPVPDSAA